jgi:hypothetical protein
MANKLLADRDACRQALGVQLRQAATRAQDASFSEIRLPESQTRRPGRHSWLIHACTEHNRQIWHRRVGYLDETGFAMGIISSGMVVTSAERRSNAKLAQPGNREWATVIQGVSSQGWCLPPFIIVAGLYHLSTWYEDSPLPQDWVIATTENGWTTNERGLEWAQHFDNHTKPRTAGEYRLLILDGHESHLSVDFELYCKKQKIITLCMPSHSSHILQPLDIGCFGPLKQAYGRQIETILLYGWNGSKVSVYQL